MKKTSTLFSMLVIIISSNISLAQQSIVWTEDFENNWTTRWYVSGGTWDVGIPLNPNGPANAFAGTNCAATNLTVNYPNGANTRLIRYDSIVVPSLFQNPRLRFWQWFQLSTGDTLKVQVSTATTGTWLDLDNFKIVGLNTGSGVWSVQELDLSAWADSTISLAFFLHADGVNAYPGWYIDNLEIRIGPSCFANPDGFENNYGDWSVDYGTWEIGIPTSGPGSAHTGSKCLATVLGGNYSTQHFAAKARSGWVKLPSAGQNPGLDFYYAYQISTGDSGTVQIRTHSSPWINLVNWGFGTALNWTFYHVPLNSFADDTVQIGFNFYSDGTNAYPGLYIDDISIAGLGIIAPCSFTGIEENKKTQSLFIYPNPAKKQFTISFESISDGNIEIYNVLGKNIYSERISNESQKIINLKNDCSGIYFVKVFDGEKSYCKKLIVE